MRTFLLAIAIIFTGLSSCKKDVEKSKSGFEFIHVLESSPQTVVVENNSLVLETNLSRDFQPICEEDGGPLYCCLELKNDQNLNLHEKIQLKKIYVIHGGKVWSKDIQDYNSGPENSVKGIAFNGPKWGPDITVDVVCEFKYNGIFRRILSKNQNIYAVI